MDQETREPVSTGERADDAVVLPDQDTGGRVTRGAASNKIRRIAPCTAQKGRTRGYAKCLAEAAG